MPESNKNEARVKEIKKKYKFAKLVDSRWTKEAREDLEFALSEQWSKDDKAVLDSQGRPALTFNIIQPLIFLASGYQRQTRSAIRAYPEGGEDVVKSEIATMLVKKVSQKSKVENKLSVSFENGIIVGKGFLEPYTDYTYDLINGQLKFRVRNPFQVRVDPNALEYDLSDAEYLFVEDYFSREKLKRMYPDYASKIDSIKESDDPVDEEFPTVGEIGDLGITKTREEVESTYSSVFDMDEESPEDSSELGGESLHYREYQYRKYITKYLAADATRGKMQLFENKKEAQAFLDQLRAADPITPEIVLLIQQQDPSFDGQEKQKVITRVIPEIWVTIMVEDTILDDFISPQFPQWKGFSILPFFANYTPLARAELKRDDLAFQGIVRSLKDPQKEKNKRRSQMLHHLNTSANSGWISVEGAWVNEEEVEQFGSSAGVNLKYKADKPKPERIQPVQLSQGHLLMEEAAEKDIKIISGINADMLAMEDKTASGKAIALRQQQGFLMLRRIFDNFSWTQELVGKYILTQLGKLFTVESAMQVLGADFIANNQVTPELVDEVLNSAEVGDYDITIGEGQDSPTTRYANYNLLMEMIEKGFPIPPDVVLDYSDLPEAATKKIIGYMQQQQVLKQPGLAV